MDHQYLMWVPDDLSFEIIDDMSEDPVVTIIVTTPDGIMKFMAEPEQVGTTLIMHATHIQGLWSNAVGAGNLIVLARTLMERMEFDEIVVEGAIRTTGANPDNRPRVFRFTRRIRSQIA